MTQKQLPVEQDEDLAQVVKGHGPCTYLLLSLVALILIYPYLKESVPSKIILGLLYSMVLVGGAYAVGRDKRKLRIGLGLAVTGIGLQWAYIPTQDVWLQRMRGLIYRHHRGVYRRFFCRCPDRAFGRTLSTGKEMTSQGV